MKKRLPVFATLLTAIRLCVDNFSFAIRIIMPWFILLLLVPNLIFVLNENDSADQLASDSGLWELADLLISVIDWCSIAVLWHWRILCDDSQRHMMVTFDGRVWLYLARVFLILVLIVGIASFVSFISLMPLRIIGESAVADVIDAIVVVGIGVFVVTVFARLSIALPPIALNVPNFGLRRAWTATEGNGLRLFFVTILPFIPVITLGAAVGLQSIDEQSLYSFSPGFFAVKITIQTVEFTLGMIGLTILSITYAFFADSSIGDNTPATVERSV